MKIFVRVVLFVLVLCLIAGLAGVLSLITPIPWLSDFVTGLTSRFTWLPLVLGAVVLLFAAISVLALVLIVSVPTKRKLFILNRDGGKIEITRQSIESEANAALGAMRELKRYHVAAKGDLRPGKLRLEVQAEPRDPNINLPRLGDAVQTQLAKVMGDCLAIEAKHVKVRIQAIEPSHESRHRHAKVPRVV